MHFPKSPRPCDKKKKVKFSPHLSDSVSLFWSTSFFFLKFFFSCNGGAGVFQYFANIGTCFGKKKRCHDGDPLVLRFCWIVLTECQKCGFGSDISHFVETNFPYFFFEGKISHFPLKKREFCSRTQLFPLCRHNARRFLRKKHEKRHSVGTI